MFHKEKENKDTSSDDESEREEMEEVDREINEKEEILLKLKEAVKGFGAMKQDYENLLCSIHTLELERNELEMALEKAKKSQPEKPVNSQAMEKLQERYLRVREELEKMKTDKNKKESTYRLIQSETKRCENLTKEITKLKEMKVKLQQTQRQQQQQHLKYKKEQSLKMGILKKSDVKRQKQMNDLKCELQKKVRVLGNKDREILRITSKLKAAEDHINQLIRLNNTRRQKLITTGTSKGNDEISSSLNGTGDTNKENQQFLQSSKSILENLIQDKIDLKYNKKILNKKLVVIKEMKEEMNEVISLMKELEKKKGDIEAVEGIDDIQTENEELLQLNSQLKSYESTLNELTSEINILNEDIADLTRQIGDTKDVSESSWEGISRGVIASLSVVQSQSLLWDYLQSKAELTDNLRDAKDRYEELHELYESSQERVRILQNEVETLQSEMKQLSNAAEKQRVNDIWTLLKSQNETSSGQKDIELNPSMQSIAIQRAQELECALSESLATEDNLKTEIYELRYQNKELLQKLQEKIMMEQISKSRTQSRNGEDHVDEEDSLNQKLKEEISHRYNELDSLWVKLGTSVVEREKTLDSIDNAPQLALQKALDEARSQHSHYCDEELTLQRKYEIFSRLLYGVNSVAQNSESNEEEESLITRTLELKQKIIPQIEEFEGRCDKLKRITLRLRRLVEEMEYDTSTLPVELQIILKMDIQYLSESSSYQPEQRGAYCLSHKVPFTASALSFMESKLLELSLECTQNISRITELLQSITPLRNRLEFRSIENFSNLSTESESVTEAGIALILDHKVKITGSVKILAFLENVLFALISLKTNREACIKSLIQFTSSFSQYFNLNIVSSPDDQGDIDIISRSYISDYLRQMNQFPTLMDSYLDSSQLGLYALANDLGISSEEYEPRMNLIANTPPQSPEELRIYSDITSPMKALEGIVPFIDEMWLKEEIEEFLAVWNERSNDANFVSCTNRHDLTLI